MIITDEEPDTSTVQKIQEKMRSVADETKPKGITLMRKSGRKIRKESVLLCNEIIHQSHHRRNKGK